MVDDKGEGQRWMTRGAAVVLYVGGHILGRIVVALARTS